MEKLYTLKEAKKLLGVTTKTIQRWDKKGRFVYALPHPVLPGWAVR